MVNDWGLKLLLSLPLSGVSVLAERLLAHPDAANTLDEILVGCSEDQAQEVQARLEEASVHEMGEGLDGPTTEDRPFRSMWINSAKSSATRSRGRGWQNGPAHQVRGTLPLYPLDRRG